MNFNSMQWFDPCTLIFVGMSFILNGFIAYFWHKKFYKRLEFKAYEAIQRIHLNETPRLGGLVLFISLVSFVTYCKTNESIQLLKLILICLIPIVLVGLKEDLFHNVEPAIRLLTLLFVGCLFRVQFTGPLPNLHEVPFLGKILILEGGISFFYVISITTFANGMNLIDGVNGLCAAAALSILGALLFLSYKTSDGMMISTIFSVIIILIPFLIFNYPFGKIFLGDLGAYSLGLMISMLTIIFFGRHPEISPWAAVLVLIYPLVEVVFSTLRRVITGVSIYHPDTHHLHLKLFYFFRPQPIYKKIANALVAPILSMLWLFPLITIAWVYQNLFFIWVAIILFILCYGLLYLIVPDFKKNSYQSHS